MAIDRIINTPTITVDQDRYEELIRAELKAEQYKKELERLGKYKYLIDIIEATEIEKEIEKEIVENESEEN